MYSKYAPIIPYVSMGNILLGDNIDETVEMLKQQQLPIQCKITPYDEVRCTIGNEMLIIANSINRKIGMLCALEEYQGMLLNKIRLGMTIPEIMKIDSTLIKIEPDNDFISFENGYFIEHELFDFSDELTTPVTEITVILKQFSPTYTDEYDNSELYRSGQW